MAYNLVISNFKMKLRSLVSENNINNHSLHKFVIVFKKKTDRNFIESNLLSDGIKTMVHYRYIIPELPSFKNFNKLSKFLKSKHLSEHSLSLPIHPFIKKDEISKITNSLSIHLSNL